MAYISLMAEPSTLARTQVQFERWQYDALKARAAREGRSLSWMVREAVAAYLAAPSKSPTLASITGLGNDKAMTGARHDDVLYPKKRASRKTSR